jgi:hypothetical protein
MITTTQAIDQTNTRTTMTECNDRPKVIRNGNDDRRVPPSGPMAAKCIESGCPIAALVAAARAKRSSVHG